MAQTTFALLTNVGRAKEAAALANATTITITHIALGDGATVPSGGETALYHEIARKTISGHGTVAGAANVAFFDIFLAANEGPYTIREAGLYDVDGDLIAIAHYDPPFNKPTPDSGQTVEGTIRLEVAFSNVANITIIVDPSMRVALQRLTRLPWIPVISMTLATPPVTPTGGDTYLIGSAPTGAWAGQQGKIAEYTSAGWAIITPPDGHGISLPDGRVFERIGGVYVEKIALDAQSGKWSYSLDTGTANSIVVMLAPKPPAHVTGMRIWVKVTNDNTGIVTIKVNDLALKDLRRSNGYALIKGDLVAGMIIPVVWDASSDVYKIATLVRSDIVKAALAPRTIVRLTTPGSGTWAVPADVSAIEIEHWGAGGGAGLGNGTTPGAGGGGGAYAKKSHAVLPGAVVSYTVGAGGLGGASAPARTGQDGGASYTTVNGVTVGANGGKGGVNYDNAGVADTFGGAPYGAYDIGITGEWGGAREVNGTYLRGGWGGSSPMGAPRTPGGVEMNAGPASPGAGAGAIRDTALDPAHSGAPGEVRISYASS